MQLQKFIDALKNLRQHQKAYFRERKPSDLIAAKELERLVDQALAEGVTVSVVGEVEIPIIEQVDPVQANLFIGDNHETKAE